MMFMASTPVFAQTAAAKSPLQTYDSVITIHQNALSRFLTILGPITGTANIKNTWIDSDVTWTVKNPKIILKKESALFSADVSAVTKSGLHYNTVAKGEVGISYNVTENSILVKVKKASFELSFNLLGNKIHLSDIDITKYYNGDMEFPAPQTVPTVMKVMLPDGTPKQITVQSIKRKLAIEPECIVISAELDFTGK